MNSQHPADVAAANARPKANCDQEVWVKERIKTAIKMAAAVKNCGVVGADEPLISSAIEGIINGAAVEIIRTLGMQPEFTNLRDVSATLIAVNKGTWTGNAGDILEKKLEELADKTEGPNRRERVDKLVQLLKRKWNISVSTKGRIELANAIR